jgi:hypothetical protein
MRNNRWRSRPIGGLAEALFRWALFDPGPQPLSFRLQETTLTIPTTRKRGSFPEVFWPSTPRPFPYFYRSVRVALCAVPTLCHLARRSGETSLCRVQCNTPPSTLCKLFYLLSRCCCFAPTVCLFRCLASHAFHQSRRPARRAYHCHSVCTSVSNSTSVSHTGVCKMLQHLPPVEIRYSRDDAA